MAILLWRSGKTTAAKWRRIEYRQLIANAPAIRLGLLVAAGDIENQMEQLPADLFIPLHYHAVDVGIVRQQIALDNLHHIVQHACDVMYGDGNAEQVA